MPVPYLFDYKYPACFICGKPVLRIAGQDIHVLPEVAQNSELDRVLGMGYVHFICLKKSKWAEEVAIENRDFLKDRCETLYHDESLSIFETVLNTISIVRMDGWYARFNPNSSVQETINGVRIAVNTEYDVDERWISHMPEIYQKLQKTNQHNTMPYVEFIDAFGVKDKLIDLDAVKHGTIEQTAHFSFDEYGSKQQLQDETGTLSARAGYYVNIPEKIWRLIP